VPPSSSTKHTNVGAIAGGVVGALVFLALLVVGLFFWRRRKRSQLIEETQTIPITFDSRPSWNQPPIRVDVTPKAHPQESKSRNQSPSVSSSHPSAPSSSISHSGESHDSTTQLRTEMEEIRREMEEMRSRQVYEEPPPLYG